MSTKHTGYAQRKRPALYWAILELATAADAWLDVKPAEKLPGSGRIMFALRRAVIAFTHASAGRNTAEQLERTRAALEECEGCFNILRRRVPKIVEEAVRRIEQILTALDRLENLDVAEWHNNELPPRSTPESGASRANTILAALREIEERVSLLVAPKRDDGD